MHLILYLVKVELRCVLSTTFPNFIDMNVIKLITSNLDGRFTNWNAQHLLSQRGNQLCFVWPWQGLAHARNDRHKQSRCICFVYTLFDGGNYSVSTSRKRLEDSKSSYEGSRVVCKGGKFFTDYTASCPRRRDRDRMRQTLEIKLYFFSVTPQPKLSLVRLIFEVSRSHKKKKTHTHTHTHCSTFLYEWSARCRCRYLHNKQHRRTTRPSAGLELATAVIRPSQTKVFYSVAIGSGGNFTYSSPEQLSNLRQGRLIIQVSISHTMTHHTRKDSPGRTIGPSQRPLPENTHPHKRQTSVPPTGFKPAIPVSVRPQTLALDRSDRKLYWCWVYSKVFID